MTDDFAVQVSYRFGPNGQDMLNIRVPLGGDLDAYLAAVIESVSDVAATGELLRAAGAAGSIAAPPRGPVQAQEATVERPTAILQRRVLPQAPPVAQTPPSAQAPVAVVGNAPACAHGLRTYRTGVGAKGPWQAWMCPTPKGTPGQCPPEWV